MGDLPFLGSYYLISMENQKNIDVDESDGYQNNTVTGLNIQPAGFQRLNKRDVECICLDRLDNAAEF